MALPIQSIDYQVLVNAAKDIAVGAGSADYEDLQILYTTTNKFVAKMGEVVVTIKIEGVM